MRDLLLLIVIVSLVVIVFAFVVSSSQGKFIGPESWLILIIIIVIIVVVLWKLVVRPSSKMSKRFSYREYGKENRKPIPIRQKPVDKKEISAFCENCGKPLKKTAKFCGGCGTQRS
jgi:hypothetical protein